MGLRLGPADMPLVSDVIGVFDSGVGGLAVLAEIHRLLPRRGTVYVADQGHAPYGERSVAQIIERSEAVTGLLLDAGAGVVVVACNTATAAAVDHLRSRHPDVPFVGMEPAVKPAAAATQTGVIGVLATAGTLSADRYQALAANHGADVQIVHRIGHGLAMDVEEGRERSPATKAKLVEHADAFAEAGADVVVLGCTHYSFLTGPLEEASAGRFQVLDPAAAVARQVVRVAGSASQAATSVRRYLTTADTPDSARFTALVGNPVTLERT